MEIAALRASTTRKLELMHPVNGPTGVVLIVASKDHPTVKATVHAKADQRNARQIQLGVAGRMKSADVDAERREIVASGILGWEGLEDAGEPVAFTPDNVAMLLDEPWILNQVDRAMVEEAAFFAA